jgi:integrase
MKRAKIRKIDYTYKEKTAELWLVTWRDLKNKRREKRFPNKRHAEDHARKIDRQIDEGVHIADRSTVTFAKACEAYLKWCDERTLSKTRKLTGATVASYKVMARNAALPWFGNTKLNKITSREVQAYVDDVSKRYAASSTSRAFIVVWNVLEYAVNQDPPWLVRNPLKDRRVDLPPTKKKSADDIPSFEAIRDLLIYLHGPCHPKHHKLVWDQRLPMVALAAFASLRVGECCALDWNCVDLFKRTVKVDEKKGSFSRTDGIKGPKSAASARTVPMNPILHNIMVRYAALVGTTGPVFRNARGGGDRRNYDSFRLQLHMAQREAGVPECTFHALRHFAGSAWLAQGMRTQDVSWLMGHSDHNTTMRTYAHQLKGDDHARQVLSEQVTRFPGIPHSLVVSPAELARLPELPPPEAPADGNVIADIRPLYQPSQMGNVAPFEAVPTIEIPPEAPQWLGYAVKLLQSGWHADLVAKEVNYDPSRLWRVFKDYGLDAPKQIRLKAMWARAQYMKDNGFSHRDIAKACGVNEDSVSRMIGRRRRGGIGTDRSGEKRPPRIIRCETCSKEFNWDKPGSNPRQCGECRQKIVEGLQLPLPPVSRLARVRHLRCEKCGNKFDWHKFGGQNPKTCPKCKSENEAHAKSLLTKVKMRSSEAEIREKRGKTQLTFWKH